MTATLTRPFGGEVPLCIKFSGGRSSAMMLRKILDADLYDPARDVIIFTNTGLEHSATLDFIDDCARRWNVKIHWLEYLYREESPKQYFSEVNYESASRNGEPMMALVQSGNCGMLPKQTRRLCTVNLKVMPTNRYLESIEMDDAVNVIGFRADEKRRVIAARERSDNYWCPLDDLGITKSDVVEFWRRQNFDLRLPSWNGITPHGNCTGCFMKGARLVGEIFAENPAAADIWIKIEEEAGRRRNLPGCQHWRLREEENSGWSQNDNGEWQHDGRQLRPTFFYNLSMRELRDMAVAGQHKTIPIRLDRLNRSLFDDISPSAAMPCECGD